MKLVLFLLLAIPSAMFGQAVHDTNATLTEFLGIPFGAPESEMKSKILQIPGTKYIHSKSYNNCDIFSGGEVGPFKVDTIKAHFDRKDGFYAVDFILVRDKDIFEQYDSAKCYFISIYGLPNKNHYRFEIPYSPENALKRDKAFVVCAWSFKERSRIQAKYIGVRLAGDRTIIMSQDALRTSVAKWRIRNEK